MASAVHRPLPPSQESGVEACEVTVTALSAAPTSVGLACVTRPVSRGSGADERAGARASRRVGVPPLELVVLSRCLHTGCRRLREAQGRVRTGVSKTHPRTCAFRGASRGGRLAVCVETALHARPLWTEPPPIPNRTRSDAHELRRLSCSGACI